MQIRLTGTRQECTDFAAVLPDLIAHCAQVRQVSGFYPNRGTSLLGRLYLDLAPLAGPSDRSAAPSAPSATTSTTRTTHGGAR